MDIRSAAVYTSKTEQDNLNSEESSIATQLHHFKSHDVTGHYPETTQVVSGYLGTWIFHPTSKVVPATLSIQILYLQGA